MIMKYRSFFHLVVVDALNKGKITAEELSNAILIPQIIFNEAPVTVTSNGMMRTFPAQRKYYYEQALNSLLNTVQPSSVAEATKKLYKVLLPYLSTHILDYNTTTNFNYWKPYINTDGTFPENTTWLYEFSGTYQTPNQLITLRLNPKMSALIPESIAIYSAVNEQSANGNNQYVEEIETELNRIKELNNQALAQLSSERAKFEEMTKTLESAIELAKKESFNVSKKLEEMNAHYLTELSNRDTIINELIESKLGDINNDPTLTMLLGYYPTFARYYIMQSALTHPEYFTGSMVQAQILRFIFKEVYDGCRFYEAYYWNKQFQTNINYTLVVPDLRLVFPNDLDGMDLSQNQSTLNYQIASRILSKYIFPHVIAENIDTNVSGIDHWRKANAFGHMATILGWFMMNQDSSYFITLNQKHMGGRMADIIQRIKILLSQSSGVKQDLELVRINTEVSIAEANKKRMEKVKEMSSIETATKEAEQKWRDYQIKLENIEREIFSLSEANKHLHKTLSEKSGLVSRLTSLIGL
jgi:hypothetical protein